MPVERKGLSRRRFILWTAGGIVTVAAGGTAVAVDHFRDTSPAPSPSPSSGRSGIAAPAVGIDPPRFVFNCATSNGSVVGGVTSLDELWASAGYTSVTRCTVRRADPSQPLTAAELDIASTGQDHPLSGAAAEAALLQALQVAAGAPAANSESFLNAHGRPAAQAGLKAAPDGPYATLIRGWLARHPR
jgi:hypothetical protein